MTSSIFGDKLRVWGKVPGGRWETFYQTLEKYGHKKAHIGYKIYAHGQLTNRVEIGHVDREDWSFWVDTSDMRSEVLELRFMIMRLYVLHERYLGCRCEHCDDGDTDECKAHVRFEDYQDSVRPTARRIGMRVLNRYFDAISAKRTLQQM